MTLIYLLYRLRRFYPTLSWYDLLIAGLEELLHQNSTTITVNNESFFSGANVFYADNEKVILDKIEAGRMSFRVWDPDLEDYIIVTHPD